MKLHILEDLAEGAVFGLVVFVVLLPLFALWWLFKLLRGDLD